MIKITSLSKVYKSKRRKKCRALDNINLTLPDTGLVFVLGKSGSGKSTLLNLIGGLDSITSGEIKVDGNDLSTFSEKDFCNYRNTHIGFVFQDYHLIDELTVYENIVLSLNLRKIEDDGKVKSALEKVHLAGYEDRYPSELSGGEQQRVAIARALVKNPRIILADEPTGNLDTLTARSITDLLKSLAKDCLILIVSHNVNDAHAYADRIIELRRGRVIYDKTKNPDFADNVTLKDGVLIYPDKTYLSDKDISLINEHRDFNIEKRTDKFIKTHLPKKKAKKVEIENKNLTFANELKLSGKFLKNKTFSIILSAFMVAVIMIIMAFSQTIIAFDAGRVMADEMKRSELDSILLSKAVDGKIQKRLDNEFRAEIGDDDIQNFYDMGYGGTIYPVFNVTVPINYCRNTIGIKSSYFSDGIFIKEALGTVVVEESFFERKFGKVQYLAKLDNPYPEGLIITDYIADCIIAKNRNYVGVTYDKILGDYKPNGWTYDTVKVNAVINTGYKERYSALFEKIALGEFESYNDYYQDEDFLRFTNDVFASLGYSFSTNPNFAETAHLTRVFCSQGVLVANGLVEFSEINTPYISFLDPKTYPSFRDRKVLMSYIDYNDIFGTMYNTSTLNTFVPHKAKFTSYRFYDVDKKNPLYTVEITIDGLTSSSDTLIIAKNSYPQIEETMRKADVYSYGLYFDGTDGIGAVLDRAESLNFEPQSVSIEGVSTMTKAVEVFVPIFELVAIFLCLGVVFILVNFSTRMIGDKMHEIGIFKALGTKNTSIAIVFGLQVLLVAALTCIMATAGYFLFIDLANDVLVNSLMRLAPGRIVLDLSFLTFLPTIALANCALTLALAAISMLIPMIKIKNIKPVKIIKAKE